MSFLQKLKILKMTVKKVKGQINQILLGLISENNC